MGTVPPLPPPLPSGGWGVGGGLSRFPASPPALERPRRMGVGAWQGGRLCHPPGAAAATASAATAVNATTTPTAGAAAAAPRPNSRRRDSRSHCRCRGCGSGIQRRHPVSHRLHAGDAGGGALWGARAWRGPPPPPLPSASLPSLPHPPPPRATAAAAPGLCPGE